MPAKKKQPKAPAEPKAKAKAKPRARATKVPKGQPADEFEWSTHSSTVFAGPAPRQCFWCKRKRLAQSRRWPMHIVCADCREIADDDPAWRIPPVTGVAGEPPPPAG
jgi:hypothetical protein